MEKTKLSKKVIAETVVLYYNSVEFPDSLYISLENSYAHGKASVVNVLNDMEPSSFDPVARIDELVRNIPSQEDSFRYFKERYNVTSPDDVTPEMEREFWENYRWEFAPEAAGIKIEWE